MDDRIEKIFFIDKTHLSRKFSEKISLKSDSLDYHNALKILNDTRLIIDIFLSLYIYFSTTCYGIAGSYINATIN
jgi:hypothetical protein